MNTPPTLLVIDGANVVGSVPDGWWRDRAGAAVRLREALRAVAENGLPGAPPPIVVVLVVEGAARGVESTPHVRVVSATGSGDDAIVDLVSAAADGQAVAVVTADRGLRDRVTRRGATVYGPRTLPRWSPPGDPTCPDARSRVLRPGSGRRHDEEANPMGDQDRPRRPSARTGAEQPWDPEDLAVAKGQDPTPKNVERARKELEQDGPAAIEKTVP